MTPFSLARTRHRVRLQAPGPLEAVGGEMVPTWVDRGTIACDVVALAGRELVNAQAARAEVDHRIRCRWFSGGTAGPPTEQWRGLWAGRVLNFRSVVDLNSARQFWEILATAKVGEVAPDGL